MYSTIRLIFLHFPDDCDWLDLRSEQVCRLHRTDDRFQVSFFVIFEVFVHFFEQQSSDSFILDNCRDLKANIDIFSSQSKYCNKMFILKYRIHSLFAA
jgi:hypothetical protein